MTSFGLWKESLKIKNEQNNEISEIFLRAFIDENTIEADSTIILKDILIDCSSLEELGKNNGSVTCSSFVPYPFSVGNRTLGNVLLYCRSNLRLSVSETDVIPTLSEKSNSLTLALPDATLTEHQISLKPSCTGTFFLFPKFNTLSNTQLNNLIGGKRAFFKGTLFLERELEQDDLGTLPTRSNPPS